MTRAAPAVTVATPSPAGAWTEWLIPLALTALAVGAAGLTTFALAMPPGYASALNAAAGIALASVLVFGWRMLGGVLVGALAVVLALDASRGRHDATTTLLLALAHRPRGGAPGGLSALRSCAASCARR